MFGDDWFMQRHVRAPGSDLNALNGAVITSFLGQVAFEPDKGHPGRTSAQRHHVGVVSVNALFEELVSGYAMYDGDLPRYTALQLLISNLRDQSPETPCVVYRMSQGDARERSVPRDTVELFQGANTSKGELVYPGDREVRRVDALTVQIHRLDVLDRPGARYSRRTSPPWRSGCPQRSRMTTSSLDERTSRR